MTASTAIAPDVDAAELLARQRRFFQTGATLPLEFRREALARLQKALKSAENQLVSALHADLRKPAAEAWAGDIAMVISDIDHALKHLKTWAKARRRRVPWIAWPGRGRVVSRPLGVALIVGPWNYPVQLTLMPLIGAIAAGNCTIVKPSEFSPATSEALAGVIRSAFVWEHVACITGDRSVSEALVGLPFDKIFFTGGTAAGRAIATAAAKNLTPVTLELGGKCPVIVCADADIRVAARRIAWAKAINAGQSCIAPDYLLLHRKVRDQFVLEFAAAVREMFGEAVQRSADYGRIVNTHHFDRVAAYLKQGTILFGGELDRADLFVAPTLMDNIQPDTPVLQEEIFGPLLPIICFDDLGEAIRQVKLLPAPLAVYVFSSDASVEERIGTHIQCGGICVNDLIVHLFARQLPFGGVGQSGMGCYHGRYSFAAFSHEQAVLRRSTGFDSRFRYPPPKLSLARYKRLFLWLIRG